MPDVREKLVELLCEAMLIFDKKKNEPGINPFAVFADHLIANGVTIQRWIPVTERLPDRTMHCVCRYVVGDIEESPIYRVLWYFTGDKTPHFQNEGSMGLRVTHWMPLPEPPKEE